MVKDLTKGNPFRLIVEISIPIFIPTADNLPHLAAVVLHHDRAFSPRRWCSPSPFILPNPATQFQLQLQLFSPTPHLTLPYLPHLHSLHLTPHALPSAHPLISTHSFISNRPELPGYSSIPLSKDKAIKKAKNKFGNKQEEG